MKIEAELKERIDVQKLSTIGTGLTLICSTLYGNDWEDNDYLIDFMKNTREKFPVLYEALYEHFWGKVNLLINEDGTGSQDCEKWKEII